MQERPDRSALLEAVSRFLLSEVHPLLGEATPQTPQTLVDRKAVAFRVLIAANLAQVVAAELRDQADEVRDQAELDRLRALLPDADAAPAADVLPGAARRQALRAANRALCAALRNNTLPADQHPQALAHLRETLRADLRLSNPRFDLSNSIED